MIRRFVLAAVLWAALAWPAAAAARLDARGAPLPTRELEALFAPALRAPGDTVALASALGAARPVLQSEGWLDARAEAEWADSARLELRIDAGARQRFASSARSAGAADSALFAPPLGVRAGEWASPGRLAAGLERAAWTRRSPRGIRTRSSACRVGSPTRRACTRPVGARSVRA